jgi:mRNA interferase HigB
MTLRTLKEFGQRYADSEGPLKAWYEEAKERKWKSPADIKATYKNASILKDNRVVFNIKGNDYRLIVKVHYNTGVVYIRFVGTHSEYDTVDADTV